MSKQHAPTKATPSVAPVDAPERSSTPSQDTIGNGGLLELLFGTGGTTGEEATGLGSWLDEQIGFERLLDGKAPLPDDPNPDDFAPTELWGREGEVAKDHGEDPLGRSGQPLTRRKGGEEPGATANDLSQRAWSDEVTRYGPGEDGATSFEKSGSRATWQKREGKLSMSTGTEQGRHAIDELATTQAALAELAEVRTDLLTRAERLEANGDEAAAKEARARVAALDEDLQAAGQDPASVKALVRAYDAEVVPIYRKEAEGSSLTGELDADVLDKTAMSFQLGTRDHDGRDPASARHDSASVSATGELVADGVKLGTKREHASGQGLHDGQGQSVADSAKIDDKGVELGRRREVSTSSAAHTAKASREHTAVLKSDEVGLRGSSEASFATAPVPGQKSAATKSSWALTSKEASASREGSASIHKGPLDLGVKTSADGRVTTAVRPVEGTQPPLYEIVVTVHFGVGGGGDASKAKPKGKGAGKDPSSASASFEGKAAADFTQIRRLDAAETKRHLDALAATKAGGSPLAGPEFDMLAKARALSDVPENLLGVVGDSKIAANLKTGDSFEIALSGEVGGKGSVGREGLGGLEASGSHKWSRSLKVASAAVPVKDQAPKKRVRVTVTFAEADEAAGKANLESGHAKGSFEQKAASSSSRGRTFELDPAAPGYDRIYGEILDAATPEQLDRLWKREDVAAMRYGTTTATSESHGRSGSADVSGLAFAVGNEDHLSGSVDANRDGVTGSFEGGQKDAASVDLAGLGTIGSSRADQAKGTVGEDGGLTLEVTTTEERKSLRSPGEGVDEALATDWSIGKVGEWGHKGAKGVVNKLVQDTKTTLSGLHLEPADVDALVIRAVDETKWQSQATAPSVGKPLAALGKALRRPKPDPAWTRGVELDEAGQRAARNLARAKALAVFLQATGDSGRNTLHQLLFYWEGTFTTDQDVGSAYEWPPELAAQKVEFDALDKHVTTFEAHARELRASANAPSGGLLDGTMLAPYAGHIEYGVLEATWQDLDQRLAALAKAISGCTSFSTARGKPDLVARIGGMRARAAAARHDDGPFDVPAAIPRASPAALQEQVARLEQQLGEFREERARLIRAAREEVEGSLFFYDTDLIRGSFDKVDELEDRWEGEHRKLVALHEALGMSGEQAAKAAAHHAPTVYGKDEIPTERAKDEYYK